MIGNYPLHLMILVLLWGYIYTSWSLMGRLGMVSFGHGAFMGIGAYTVVMLWNHFGVSPWLGALAGIAVSAAVALAIGFPCFRFKIVGHYFALVTLALSEVARMIIVALRDQTGGSLGATPKTALADTSWSLVAMQFSSKLVWYYIILAVWLAGLWIWGRVDRSMARLALEAISQEEDAAASIGIGVDGRVGLDRHGHVISELPVRAVTSAWSRIWRPLRQALPDASRSSATLRT
jgi:branched-chain amino acid transport system permease protein